MKNYLIFSILMVLLMSLSLYSCGDELVEDTEDTEETELTILSLCKYSISLDGNKIEKEANYSESGISCNVYSGGSIDGLNYGSSLYSNDSEEELSIVRGTIYNIAFSELPTPKQFDSLFFVGNYEYTKFGDDGVLVSYDSPEGIRWSSDNGSAEQPSSKFELLEKVSKEIFGVYVLNVRVKFSCNLYNSDGDVKKCVGTATFGLEVF